MKQLNECPDFLKNGYALVFSGGGAKGAWQIGAWQAFIDHGVPAADLVSGTSVGALNAALYSQYAGCPEDFQKVRDIWEQLNTETVLTGENSSALNRFNFLFKRSFTFLECSGKGFYSLLQQIIPMVLYPLPPKDFFVKHLSALHENIGIFSQEGLKNLMKKGLQTTPEAYRIPAVICAHNKNRGEVDYLKLNDFEHDSKISILLASTAIPFIFPNVAFNGDLYCDGGFGVEKTLYLARRSHAVLDNMPIQPLTKPAFNSQGLKTVVALALNPEQSFSFDNPEFKGLQIFPIFPSEDLGSPLDFSPEKIQERMKLGYKDAEAWLKKACEDLHQTRQLQLSENEFTELKKEFDDIDALQNELIERYDRVIETEKKDLLMS